MFPMKNKTIKALVREHGGLRKKMVEIEKELERRYKDKPERCEYCKQPLVWRHDGRINDSGISVYMCECIEDMK